MAFVKISEQESLYNDLEKKSVLQEAAQALGITIGTIIKDPMEGLVKYHSAEA